MKYLTPAQYRLAYEGTVEGPTASTVLTDAALARYIMRAEAAIDAYVGFNLQTGGFEPHVMYAQRGFNIKTRRFPNYQHPVPMRNVQRYRIHVSNVGSSGAGFYATLNTGDAVINDFESYIEVVPLQATTYALTPILVQLGLLPPIAEVDTEVGFYLPYLGDTLYNDTGDLKTYRSVRGFWASTYTQAVSDQPNTLPPVPPAVYKNGGTALSSSLYTVNYTEGTITFASPLLSSDIVTADYTGTIPDVVIEACIEQVTYFYGQRALSQQGMLGVELGKAGGRELRRSRTDDTVEDGLCARARMKLTPYKPIAIA